MSARSLRAAPDLDRDDPQERARALVRVPEAPEAIEGRFSGEDGAFPPRTPEAGSAIETARRVREQDVEGAADGTPGLRRGVARERRISVEDPQMRHGRKSKNRRFDGYERDVLRDLDTQLGLGRWG